MGVFFFATAIFGTIGTFVIGWLVEDFHIQSQERKGWLLTVNTALPCLASSILFYVSAGYYERFRNSLEMDREEAQTKASNYMFEEGGSVGDYGYFAPNNE